MMPNQYEDVKQRTPERPQERELRILHRLVNERFDDAEESEEPKKENA